MTKKILVIDDDEDILRTMKQILDHQGCEVDSFSQPRDAIDQACKKEYDVILVDLLMPVSGYDVVKEIKKGCAGDPRFVFVTIVPKKEVNLQNVHGFIQKPFVVTDFIRTVEKVSQEG